MLVLEGDLWLTPALRETLAGIEVVFLLFGYLFGLNYRRVEWTTDVCDVYARSLAGKSGFTLEAVV